MIGKHKVSLLLLIAAIGIYLVFGFLIPEMYYSEPQTETEAAADAIGVVGVVVKSVVPYITLVMSAMAVVLFIKEQGN